MIADNVTLLELIVTKSHVTLEMDRSRNRCWRLHAHGFIYDITQVIQVLNNFKLDSLI